MIDALVFTPESFDAIMSELFFHKAVWFSHKTVVIVWALIIIVNVAITYLIDCCASYQFREIRQKKILDRPGRLHKFFGIIELFSSMFALWLLVCHLCCALHYFNPDDWSIQCKIDPLGFVISAFFVAFYITWNAVTFRTF